MRGISMPDLLLPSAAVLAALPLSMRPKIVSAASEPPRGDNWLHEVKHDGHRLVAIVAGAGSIKLLSRNGIDRTPLFRAPFRDIQYGWRQLVLDGEIAVPDERGVTHIDALNDALAGNHSDRLTFFAFDLIYANGHDLRRCPIEQRKALLKDVLDHADCERIVYLDHIMGDGDRLFEHVRAMGAEGIVSKRLGCSYRHGDWLKTKCYQVGRFFITGFQELGEGRLEAVHVAEEIGGNLRPAGQVRFGFAGRGLWGVLAQLRSGEPVKGVIPVHPALMAEIKFYGRYKGGSIRDGVLLDLIRVGAGVGMASKPEPRVWDCDAAGRCERAGVRHQRSGIG
jgi:bifunctional non-homologous end joining protein LigD